MATSAPVPMAMPRSAWARARGVVDAVAGHRDHVALLLQLAHLGGLVGGQHVGEDVGDADLGGDGVGGGGVVAGDHPHLEPEGLELGDGLGGLRLDGVGHGDDGGELVVDGDVHRGLAAARGGIGDGGQLSGIHAGAVHHGAVADPHPAPVDGRVETVAGDGLEGVQGRQGEAGLAGVGDDGLADGVLAAALGGGDQGEDLALVPAADGRDTR